LIGDKSTRNEQKACRFVDQTAAFIADKAASTRASPGPGRDRRPVQDLGQRGPPTQKGG
jgi:hypothetical protein